MYLKRFINNIACIRRESGVALVEALIAVAVLGGGILTMVLAMSGGAMAVRENDCQATAQALARSQLEYVKNYTYNATATTYPIICTPAGYGISVGVSEVPGGNPDIQKITANITEGGTLIMTVEGYKVNR
jgi:Tfp pilus assembly protein PilV